MPRHERGRACSRFTSARLFGALVVAQAAHSVEEILFRLYDVFAPARAVSLLVSDSPTVGFVVLNASIVAFGLWCYLTRIRVWRPSSARRAWPWAVVELANGTMHIGMASVRGAYFPGVVTAPLLIWLAARLADSLRRA